MSKPKYILIAIVTFLMLTFSAGCSTQEQYLFFVTLGNGVENVVDKPETLEHLGMRLDHARANWSLETATPSQHAVLSELSRQAAARTAAPKDCISAMKQVFPSSTWSWGERIIMRESRNNPSAQNSVSSAAGCWQLLSMHNHRYYAVGCSPAQKYDALCNNKAAYHLYQAAGSSPWRVY